VNNTALAFREVERQHLPLLLASEEFASADASEPLDRLRMQKGVFLLEMRGPPSWKSLYTFQPYDWGPYSRLLQSDLGSLMNEDLLEKEDFTLRRYMQYRTTRLGDDQIEAVIREMPTNHRVFIESVRGFVTTRSFTQLLRDVYAEYPQAAISDLNFKVRTAVLRLDRTEADLLRELSLDALESDEAKAFLSSIPSVSELVPGVRLAEIEASLGDGPFPHHPDW